MSMYIDIKYHKWNKKEKRVLSKSCLKNLQLKESNLKKVDLSSSGNTVKNEVLEEVLLDNSGSGKNISKSIKSANTNLGGGPGVIDDVVTAGAGTADDAASSIVNQITSKPAVKPKFAKGVPVTCAILICPLAVEFK